MRALWDLWSFSLVTGLLNYIYTDLVDPTHSTTGTVTAQLETTQVSAAPLPAALLLFATGLGGMGLLGWWRKRDKERRGSRSRLNDYI